MKCELCPRKCGVDRAVTTGVCGVGEAVRIAKVSLHQWEEPCISGERGSGTIFFSGCSLKCVFCQNYEISDGCHGKDITTESLADAFKDLESKGAHNINLVSPTHYVDAIISALKIYRPNIPVVYNTSGYERVETLEKLRGYVDIFLVDLKYMDSALSLKYSHAPDYPQVATKAILKMRELEPKNEYENGILKRGVIIRHLVLPNHTEDSVSVLQWIADNTPDAPVSLMGQYTPMHKANQYPEIARPLKPIEYKMVLNKMVSLGLEGYAQELSSADTFYVPKWDC